MTSFLWKFNRLRAMGGGEVLYRMRHAAQALWERLGFGRVRPRTAREGCGRAWVATLPESLDKATYVAAADRVLAGRFDVFALRDVVLGFPPLWNRDPKTGTQAPLVFGKTLNYRDERVCGDIKYLWEPNRHAELVTLAQAWRLTGDARYAMGCRALLESWFEQCPYPLGVNWTSSLEHAMRLLHWAVAWHILHQPRAQSGGVDASGVFSGDAGQSFQRRWLDSVYLHCRFIAGHLSRYSSANNHLLGELAGLLVASLTWPCWPESATWLRQATREFEIEALKQTASDGVNREQATWYHHEVAEMLLLAGLFAKANGVQFAAEYGQRLEKMVEFVAALMDVGGNVPMIGDADDARIVRWVPGDDDVYRSLLATAAVLFERPEFARKAGKLDDKSRWLLGDVSQGHFDALLRREVEDRVPRAFPEGGYYVLGTDLDSHEEIRVVADAGPLGYLSIAAHGHADALAMTLSVAGREMLIDPGTYAYHTQKVWRDYFRGTSAHNTLRVDGLDQSVISGNFMWQRHASARCLAWQPGEQVDHWMAEHYGYRRLSDPVTHRRQIRLDKMGKRLEVEDRLDCRGHHRFEMFWHFAEDADVSLVDGRVLARKDGVELVLCPPAQLTVRLARGEIDPPLGWISRSFDVKTPCTTVIATGVTEGNWHGRTSIAISMFHQKGKS